MHLWLDWFAVVLACIVAAAYFADFLIGEDGNKQVRGALISGWYYFSTIPIKVLGAEEAKFTLHLFDSLVGPKLLSWRRFFASLAITCIGISIGYLIVENYRWQNGIPFEWPFSASHFHTGFPSQIPGVMVSLSVTRWVLAWSVTRLGSRPRLGWLLLPIYAILALLAYLLADAASGIVAIFVGLPLKRFIYNFVLASMVTGTWGDIGVVLPSVSQVWATLTAPTGTTTANTEETYQLAPIMTFLGWSIQPLPGQGDRPLDYFRAFVLTAVGGFPSPLHSLTIGWITNGMRIALGAAFIGSWIAAYLVYRPVELILRRLAESTKAPLGHIALGLSGLAKLIQVLFKPGVIL